MIDVLMIGVGGTGVKTLLHTKKLLIDQQQNLMMPRNVQLLAIDTCNDQEKIDNINTAGGADIWKRTSNDKQYTGALELDTEEYLRTAGNLYSFAFGDPETNTKGLPDPMTDPHAWFNLTYFSTRPNLLQVEHGAGRYRQVGRLALFNALASGENGEFCTKLGHKIDELDTHFLVFVIGSLAGGTGAAQFIDVAHLAKAIAKSKQKEVQAVYGMLALPEAFRHTQGVTVTDDMHARATIGMRELQRFMQAIDPKMGYLMDYVPGQREPLSTRTKGALFDNVYLFGERYQGRAKTPADKLQVDIKFGVTATMAQWVVALADPLSGEDFLRSAVNRTHGLQALTTKLSNEVTARGGYNPDYVASVGSYSVVLPVATIVEEWTARFGKEEVLDRLVPVDSTGRLVTNRKGGRSGQSGAEDSRKGWETHPCGIAKDAGEKGAHHNPLSLTKDSTPAVGDISDIVNRDCEKWLPLFTSGTGVDQETIQGLPGADDEKKVYFYNVLVKGLLAKPLEGGVVPNYYPKKANGNSHEVAGKALAAQCNTNINSLLNGYRDAMNECVKAQVRMFRSQLGELVNQVLNGVSSNEPKYAEENRAGKLGWMVDYLRQWRDDLESARIIWQGAETSKIPNPALDPCINSNTRLYGPQLVLERDMLKKIPSEFVKEVTFSFQSNQSSQTFLDMIRDEKYQKDYMQEVQRVWERERWHLYWLMEYYTICQFAEYVDQMYQNLMGFVSALRGKPSVSTKLEDQGEALEVNREGAAEWKKVREIVQKTNWENDKYGAYIQADPLTGIFPWQKVLNDLNWKVQDVIHDPNTPKEWHEPVVALFINGFQLSPEGDLKTNNLNPIQLTQSETEKQATSDANLKRLNARCRVEFSGAWDELNILDYLNEAYTGTYPKNSQGFAENMAKHCDVLLQYGTGTVERLTYLLAPEGGNTSGQQWLDLVSDAIKKEIGVTQTNYGGIMRHSDRTSLTLFALVDWVPLESLAAYNKGKTAYFQYPSDPNTPGLSRPLDHLFPAEQKACRHDEDDTQDNIRLIMPRVTALFDEEERLKRYIRAWALGFLKRKVDVKEAALGGGNLLVFEIPSKKEEDGNAITRVHWLNKPEYFINDEVPYLIGAETACLRDTSYTLEEPTRELRNARLTDIHKELEEVILARLQELYENEYRIEWAQGRGDPTGIVAFKLLETQDKPIKLRNTVLRLKYMGLKAQLEPIVVEDKYWNTPLTDAYAIAARPFERQFLRIVVDMLDKMTKDIRSSIKVE